MKTDAIDSPTAIVYPSSDGEPVAETYIHFYAMMTTLEVLRQYLIHQTAKVLGNQFLYYAQGFPKLRVAPDVMVIFDVPPGGRDHYKIWEEGQVPRVIVEITSPGTKDQDLGFKKTLYEQLEVSEYWLFDPKGEWISEKLQGYQLQANGYQPITDGISEALQLRLVVDGELISFYRLDNHEKLLTPDELATAQKAAEERANQAEARLQEIEELLAKYRDNFGDLPP